MTTYSLYIIIALSIVAIIWGRMLWQEYNSTSSVYKEYLHQCKSCNKVFIINRLDLMAKCPQCHKISPLNKKRKI